MVHFGRVASVAAYSAIASSWAGRDVGKDQAQQIDHWVHLVRAYRFVHHTPVLYSESALQSPYN